MARREQAPGQREADRRSPRGARIADRVTGFLGIWRFLIVQTVIVAFWMLGNIWLLSNRSTRIRSSCSTLPSRPRPPTPPR